MKTLRNTTQLCEHGLLAPEQRAALGRGRRALRGGDAAGDGRADRPRTTRPIRSRGSSCPTWPNSTSSRQERADPIGDDAHSPVEGIVHRYPDRVLLKLTQVCAVYCRFCFRREMVGPEDGSRCRRRRSSARSTTSAAGRRSGK